MHLFNTGRYDGFKKLQLKRHTLYLNTLLKEIFSFFFIRIDLLRLIANDRFTLYGNLNRNQYIQKKTIILTCDQNVILQAIYFTSCLSNIWIAIKKIKLKKKFSWIRLFSYKNLSVHIFFWTERKGLSWYILPILFCAVPFYYFILFYKDIKSMLFISNMCLFWHAKLCVGVKSGLRVPILVWLVQITNNMLSAFWLVKAIEEE